MNERLFFVIFMFLTIKKAGKTDFQNIISMCRNYFPLLEPVLTADTFFAAAGFADFDLSAVAALGFAGVFLAGVVFSSLAVVSFLAFGAF